jgi:hypothetical protein
VEIDRPDESPLALDGNAAGGLLCELFAFDMTAASITCDGCGTVSQVGELALYGGAMGAIFRWSHCDTAVIRLTRTPAGFRIDMHGTRILFAHVAA